jgi:hydroxyquinol 1,2-dioxygenase
MIIGDQNEVTIAVLQAMEKTPDPRLRELVTLMIKHLHGFIREAKLSEEEFHQACNLSCAWARSRTPRITRWC